MAGGFEFAAEFTKVVDLAVEDDPVPGRQVLHRLVAQRREVDDGKPSVSETELAISARTGLYDDGSGIVGAAVREGARSIFEDAVGNTFILGKNSEDATHDALLEGLYI